MMSSHPKSPEVQLEKRLIPQNEVLKRLVYDGLHSDLNSDYDLKAILEHEQPSAWQELADNLAEPLRDYISQEYGLTIDVSPVVPQTEVIFECVKTLPYFMFRPQRDLWGIHMGKLEKAWSYFTATHSDILGIPRVWRWNKEHPSDKASYWGLTREVIEALNAGGDELINIFRVPNYQMFVYTTAHEVGHSVAHKLSTKRGHHEDFASTFGLRVMDWFMAQR